jgi:hypothetical protein
VHALSLDKDIPLFRLIFVDDGPLLVIRFPGLFQCAIVQHIRDKQVMFFTTSDLARPAADATGCVNQDSNELLGILFLLGAGPVGTQCCGAGDK